jgi:5-methylcytosine-specific restriction endonuclease McrA
MLPGAVRVPPPRPFERIKSPRGQYVCPMCGVDAGYKRGWWHKECAEMWNLSTNPRWQLRELWANVGTKCWACLVGHGIDVDHIKPLWSLTAQERKELKWWLPFNLQVLCRECHAIKTKREAGERAAIRRAAA